MWYYCLEATFEEYSGRVFKTRWFARFSRRHGIGDAALCEAVARASGSIIDAQLAGCVIKQRIARAGDGRSGGFRAIVAFAPEVRSAFMFCFAKSDRANLTAAEERAFRELAALLLSYTDAELAAALSTGALVEVICNG